MSVATPHIAAPSVSQRQPYPAYKDSGVEWLRDIPVHWSMTRIKYVVAINSDALPENTEPDHVLRYVDIGNVDSNGVILNAQDMRFEDAPSRARRLVQSGDVIISTVRTYLKAIAFVKDADNNGSGTHLMMQILTLFRAVGDDDMMCR